MNKEKFKKQRTLRLWNAETTSLLICDVYKDVKEVKLAAEITFNSGVLRQPSVKEWRRTLTPNDRLHLHHECINKDCTSYGFDLTNALRDALSSRICVEGEMSCTGKEDWKYAKNVGCTCMTTLKYRIEPKFKDIK